MPSDVNFPDAALDAPPPPAPADAFRLALPNFEGPLDLLLHLIQSHRLDIFDIPIARVTEKYLEHLERMRELDLDIAGEFFVMAATLAQIKSRMLLPRPPPLPDESPESADPRAELVRRLLTYQKFRDAALKLSRRDLYDRDVFGRRARPEPLPPEEGDLGIAEVSVIKLVDVLDRALRRARIAMPHEILAERISINDAIQTVTDRLRRNPRRTFLDLLEVPGDRSAVIITFLAILELAKLRVVRIFQDGGQGEIWVAGASPEALGLSVVPTDDYRS